MNQKYFQLTHDQRLQIEVLRGRNLSQRAIAAKLEVSPSTICRELARAGAAATGWYFAIQGQAARSNGRQSAGAHRSILGTDLETPAWRHVLNGLRVGWSPEQLAGRLKFNAKASPEHHSFTVSHETIYCAIYAMPRGALRTELVKLLRQSRSGRRPRARGADRTSTALKDMTPIALRPPEVCARIVPGHWEGDLIKGARNQSAVGTLVERTSRYLMLAKLDGADSGSVLNGFTNRLKSIPESLRKTLTYDQGSEMALHKTLSQRLRLDVYFCDAHSPWQRGSNENANGLIREYLPKGTDLSVYSHQALSAIEQSLNNRPRKILGYRTPAEVFDEIKLHGLQGVALQA